MAVLRFPSPYPYGPPRKGPDLTALSDLLKAMKEARKRKYEAELWKDILGEIDKPAKKSEISELLGKVTAAEPEPTVGLGAGLGVGAGPGMPTPQAPPQAPPQMPFDMGRISELLSTMPAAPQYPIPEAMRTRMAGQPQGGFFQRIGQAFSPAGPYRGPATELEKSFITKGLERRTADPLTRMGKQLEFITNLRKAMEKPEWKPTTWPEREREIKAGKAVTEKYGYETLAEIPEVHGMEPEIKTNKFGRFDVTWKKVDETGEPTELFTTFKECLTHIKKMKYKAIPKRDSKTGKYYPSYKEPKDPTGKDELTLPQKVSLAQKILANDPTSTGDPKFDAMMDRILGTKMKFSEADKNWARGIISSITGGATSSILREPGKEKEWKNWLK